MQETNRSIKCFKQLLDLLNEKKIQKRVVVTWPEEGHTRQAVQKALEKGFIKPIFVCSMEVAKLYKDYPAYSCIVADSPETAAQTAVRLVREGGADIIMKGFVSTDVLLKSILNKEEGILEKGKVMTHIAVAQLPKYDKLLFFSDAAVIPFPTDEQREKQIEYITKICHAFQIEQPKVSLLHCSEKPDERHFPYTAHYLKLKELSKQGKYGNCIIDGPLDLKTSLSLEALHYKKIDSPIEGQADALIFPNIEAGNVFYKAITLFDDAQTAAILQGPKAPVVLPSRGDTVETKFYSLALATLISNAHAF